MAERPESDRRAAVLVIDSDSTYRKALEQACRAAGLPVLAVSCIAEVERWPAGQIVVTDAAHLTPWWRLVGATEVIVLVRNADEAVAAFDNGATRWLQPPPSAEMVATMVLALTHGGPSGNGLERTT
jgi:DNA-binding NtrC family response regulator